MENAGHVYGFVVPDTGAVTRRANYSGMTVGEKMRNDSFVQGGCLGQDTGTRRARAMLMTTKVIQSDLLCPTFFRGAEKLYYPFHTFAVTYWH